MIEAENRITDLEVNVIQCTESIKQLEKSLQDFHRMYVDRNGLLTFKEIHAVYRIPPSTVSRWVAHGKIKPYADSKNKQLYRFKKSDVETLMKKKNG